MAVPPRETALFPQPIPIAAGRAIAAPFQFLTTGEDHLRLTQISMSANAAIALTGRYIDLRGDIRPIAYRVNTDGTRGPVTADFSLAPGALLNLAVKVGVGSSAEPRYGEVFVILELIRGFSGATEVLGVLLQGYVTRRQGLGWPGSPVSNSVEFGGLPREYTGTAPAAGAVISEVVPNNSRWRILSAYAQLTTSAAAATRNPYCAIKGQGGLYYVTSYSNVNQTASQTKNHHWTIGLDRNTGLNPAWITNPWADGPWMTKDMVLEIGADSLQAGDTFSAPRILLLDALEGL